MEEIIKKSHESFEDREEEEEENVLSASNVDSVIPESDAEDDDERPVYESFPDHLASAAKKKIKKAKRRYEHVVKMTKKEFEERMESMRKKGKFGYFHESNGKLLPEITPRNRQGFSEAVDRYLRFSSEFEGWNLVLGHVCKEKKKNVQDVPGWTSCMLACGSCRFREKAGLPLFSLSANGHLRKYRCNANDAEEYEKALERHVSHVNDYLK